MLSFAGIHHKTRVRAMKKTTAEGARSPFKRLRRWFRDQIQEVDDELAVCEFECRKECCRMGEWEKCELRKR